MRILRGEGAAEQGGKRGVGGGVGAASDGGVYLLRSRKGEMDEGDGESMAEQGAGDGAGSELGGEHGDDSKEEDDGVKMESMGAGWEEGRSVREKGGEEMKSVREDIFSSFFFVNVRVCVVVLL